MYRRWHALHNIMKITLFQFILFISLFSCSLNKTSIDKQLKSISTYDYTFQSGIEYANVNVRMFKIGEQINNYKQLITRKYDANENLLEESTFDLQANDTVFSHFIGFKFNKRNQVIQTIDSMKMLKTVLDNYYNEGLLSKSKTLTIYSESRNINGIEEWFPADSGLIERTNFYDNNQCTHSIFVNKVYERMIPEAQQFPDSIITTNFFNTNGEKFKSVSIINKDTLSIVNREFDELSREISSTTLGDKYVWEKSTHKFDANGNKIRSMIDSETFSERVEIKYNTSNQMVESKSYELE
jgi:hypothetical protein